MGLGEVRPLTLLPFGLITRFQIYRTPLPWRSAAEFTLHFGGGDLHERGTAMWAAVGHFAGEEVFEQRLQLGNGKHVVAFHRSTAGSGGYGVFAEAQRG